MSTTPFVAFRTPRPSPWSRPEAVALGLAAGAVIGAVLPIVCVTAEILAAGSVSAAVTAPSAALLASLAGPALGGGLGAWIYPVVDAHRRSYEAISRKAASLVDESWDLQVKVDALELRAPPLPVHVQEEISPDPDWIDEATPATFVPRGQDELVQAQAQLLESIGEATEDATRRMRVNLRGLMLTPRTVVQDRLIVALESHVEALGEISRDVLDYAREDVPVHRRREGTGSARATAA